MTTKKKIDWFLVFVVINVTALALVIAGCAIIAVLMIRNMI